MTKIAIPTDQVDDGFLALCARFRDLSAEHQAWLLDALAAKAERMGTPSPYDPDLGFVEITEFKLTPTWKKAENWGPWLAYPEDGADHYHEVWMLVSPGGRVRFVARGGKQYGPELKDAYTATAWAFGHGWRDPGMSDEFNVKCIVECRSGVAQKRASA